MSMNRRCPLHPDDMMPCRHVYDRMDYANQQHRARFKRFVKAHGLLCQDCGGAGHYTEIISQELGGPRYECGWCEGTGRVTRHLRGIWLRWKREARRLEKAT